MGESYESVEELRKPASESWEDLKDALIYWSDGPGSEVRFKWEKAEGTPEDAPIVITYSFGDETTPLDDKTCKDYENVPVSFSDQQKEAAKLAMAEISRVANVTFVEDKTGNGNIVFVNAKTTKINPETGGVYHPAPHASYPGQYGEAEAHVHITAWDINATTEKLIPGSDDGCYDTLLHELCHAMGLTHPFLDCPYRQADGAVYLDKTEYEEYSDQIYTIMSENNSQTQGLEPATLMPLDIAALQYLYGANTSYNAGDDVYAWDTVEVPVWGPEFSHTYRNTGLSTIVDSGGVDTIDCSNQINPCVIDLTEGGRSSMGVREMVRNAETGVREDVPAYHISIAYGAEIENALGGSNNDVFILNGLNNVCEGGGGDDDYYISLYGGLDTIKDSEGVTTIHLAEDITSDMLRFEYAGSNSTLYIGDEGDGIKLNYEDAQDYNIVFANGEAGMTVGELYGAEMTDSLQHLWDFIGSIFENMKLQLGSYQVF